MLKKIGEFLEASQLVDRGAEFSSVTPAEVGQNSRYTYRYPMEPVFVSDSTNPDRGYLTLLINLARNEFYVIQ